MRKADCRVAQCCCRPISTLLIALVLFVVAPPVQAAIDYAPAGYSLALALRPYLQTVHCYQQELFLLSEHELASPPLDHAGGPGSAPVSGPGCNDSLATRRGLADKPGGIEVSGAQARTVRNNIVDDDTAGAEHRTDEAEGSAVFGAENIGERNTIQISQARGVGAGADDQKGNDPAKAVLRDDEPGAAEGTDDVAPTGSGEAATPPPGSAASAAPSPEPPPPPPPEPPKRYTFKPGFRVQVRYGHDERGEHDLRFRRFRGKGGGKVFGVAKYYVEVKVDNVARINAQPQAVVENAWMEFPVNSDLSFRAGLYDVPFSRNALTSDSKLLFMDRSLIKNELTRSGLADNTVGLLAHGRPLKGRLEYSAGVFNNIRFKRFTIQGDRQTRHLMTAGRFVVNLLDPSTPGSYADYRGSYIGKGRRLAIGTNGAYLPSVVQQGSSEEFNLYAWGTDLFFNTGRLTIAAEYDWFTRNGVSGTPSVQRDGWYIQAGFMIWPKRLELAAQHQEVDADREVVGDNLRKLRWTSIGLNYYIREHHIKVQTEYAFKQGERQPFNTDLFQIQLQVDY